MTIRFLHIRRIDEEGYILPKGGLTLAFTIFDYHDNNEREIIYTIARCSYDDLFCYAHGRELAQARLVDTDQAHLLEIVPEVHPRTSNLATYIGETYFDEPILIQRNSKGRYVSTFEHEDYKVFQRDVNLHLAESRAYEADVIVHPPVKLSSELRYPFPMRPPIEGIGSFDGFNFL